MPRENLPETSSHIIATLDIVRWMLQQMSTVIPSCMLQDYNALTPRYVFPTLRTRRRVDPAPNDNALYAELCMRVPCASVNVSLEPELLPLTLGCNHQ